MNQSQLASLDLSPIRLQVNNPAPSQVSTSLQTGGPIITQPVQASSQLYAQQPSPQNQLPAWSQPQQSRAVVTPGPSTVPVVTPVQNNQSFNNGNQSFNNQPNYGNNQSFNGNNQSFNGPQPIKYANGPVRGPPQAEAAFWMCCCETYCASVMVARVVCILDILFYFGMHISPSLFSSGYNYAGSSIGTVWIIMLILGILGVIFAVAVLILVGNPTHGLKILGYYRWYRLAEMCIILIFGIILLIWGFVLMSCSTIDFACILYKALGYFLVVYAIVYLINLAWYVCLHKSLVNAYNALAGIVTTRKTTTTTTNVMVQSPNASFQQQSGMY